MTQHNTQLSIEMTEQEIVDFINGLPSTHAGLPGFEVTNQTILDSFLPPELIGAPPAPTKMIVGGIGVNTTDTTVREYEAFGVKLNDSDDVFSVGIVLLIVGIIYIGKCSIDHWFAARLERYKNKL